MPDALCFPAVPVQPRGPATTTLVLDTRGERLPAVRWLGPVHGDSPPDAEAVVAAAGEDSGVPLLAEHSGGRFTSPGLRGHRLGDATAPAGHDWSTALAAVGVEHDERSLVVEAVDEPAGLAVRTEVEALPGGALRARHTLTNTGRTPYLLEGLDVTLPLPDSHTEVLDFTGRHERERIPQRHPLEDGLWLRAGRNGTPGLNSPTMLVAGTRGFGFADGDVVAVHVGWSGNAVLRLERDSATGATIGGGENLLPGEVALAEGESYTGPWVYVVAASDGLDGVAAALHTWQRTLPAHPDVQPVTLNVWEAVYFDHDQPRLTRLADLAAQVGVERFVLDDGWFHSRRDDTAGLGDWWVDPAVWPEGLTPLVDHVHGLGMQFGLWFEPEMVNPDSDLFRAHPEWVLSTGGRTPLLARHQLVVDLTHPGAWSHIRDAVDAVLSQNAVDFVKWDHNRELLDAGATTRGGVPAVHDQSVAYYALLDDLRSRHPDVVWESCASGGGRIDLEVVQHVGRFWTSDMTDALSRQQIQRWSGQLVAPEYLGAHVSAPTSHQTGRTLGLDFRAATALFCGFGIEWDLTRAGEQDLVGLAEWVARYQQHRALLHGGRAFRAESSDPAVLLHGVVAADRRTALVAHVQMEESAHNRGVRLRVPGLEPQTRYEARWEGPVDRAAVSRSAPLPELGPTGGAAVSGALLEQVGLWYPRRRPETATLVLLAAGD